MKVEKQFSPIIITLENKDEVDAIKRLLSDTIKNFCPGDMLRLGSDEEFLNKLLNTIKAVEKSML
jgi:hypothetical protein